MCFELDSVPPIPPISGGAPVRSEDVVLESADGTQLAAFAAQPDDGARVGIVVLPDVRGLYRFYEELALRFAERGYAAVAFDYFGRTCGCREARRRVPVHGARRAHDARGDPAGPPRRGRAPALAGGRAVRGRVRGRLLLRRPERVARDGGGHGLAGAVGFYGSTGERNGAPGPTQRAAEFGAPILALQAGDDANILPEHNAAFDAALTAAGVDHEVVVYDGAPHSFFDRRQEDYAEQSADAWERTLAFIERHTPR